MVFWYRSPQSKCWGLPLTILITGVVKMWGKHFVAGLAFLAAVQTQAKDFISVTAVGDVMMGTTYPSNALPENNGKGLFSPALQWLQASDIRFGNFEGTFFDGGPQADGKTPGPNRFLFKSPTSMVSALSEGQFNVVSLSNNHAHDFGRAGLNSTKETLKNAGIQFSSKDGEVANFRIDETDVALIAVDFYKAPRSITEPASTYLEISKLKQQGKLVIVSAHAGGEGDEAIQITFGKEIFLGENRGDSVGFARAAIDNGADLILMAGPHVPRGMEVYKGRLVAYSLGNFMTGKGISLSGYAKVAPLLRVQIAKDGEFKRGQIVSFIQGRDPQRIEIDKQATALKMMKKLSHDQFPDSLLSFADDGMLQAP
jgi:poly-gamma-glutamate capsule biosynthesis protein CapA/YwtB (metallophosphatase superfamily)